MPPQKLKEIIDFTLPSEGSGIDPDLKCKLACLFSLLLNVCVSLLNALHAWLTCSVALCIIAVEKYIEQVLEYSVRTGSPRYFNQLWSGTDIACKHPSFLFHPCVALLRLSQIIHRPDSLLSLSAHTLLITNSHRMQALSLNGCPHSLILRLTPMKWHLSTHCMSPKLHLRDEMI